MASEAANRPSAVSCAGVGKTWAAGTSRAHEALRAIDLDIAPGEFVGVPRAVGLRQEHLALTSSPAWRRRRRGGLLSDGQPITRPSPNRSLIFQETSLFPWLSVGQNVSYGLRLRGAPQAEQTGRGARGAAARRARGRHRQGARTSCRAVCANGWPWRAPWRCGPEILLMDEPFAALDVQTRAKMQGFLLDVWRDSGASVLFVTHHIDEAVALADRVVVFTARPGRIKQIVPIDMPRPRELFSAQAEGYRRELKDLLRDEVDRAFAEQEGLALAAG